LESEKIYIKRFYTNDSPNVDLESEI
jgi:hypothetical protein